VRGDRDYPLRLIPSDPIGEAVYDIAIRSGVFGAESCLQGFLG
jgi:hypothetical protein